MRAALIAGAACVALAAGFAAGKIDDHVRPTMWGWVWELTPTPDPNPIWGTQLVKCPNGDVTLPPWHVRVLWDDDLPLWQMHKVFWQERGY
jgi:hypothetical protein